MKEEFVASQGVVLSCLRTRHTLSIPHRMLSLGYGIIVALFPLTLPAQNWSIESTLHAGQVIKHSPEMLFDTKGSIAYGQELNTKYQTYGKHEWNQHQGFPQLGISLLYFNFGKGDLLGHAHAIMPNMTVHLLRREKWYIQFQYGTGLARLNRPFNIVANPKNNAIGSHWNNITAARFDIGYRLHPKWQIQSGFGLTHFSNGGSQLPNLGVNAIAGHLGFRYTPHPVEPIPNGDISKKKEGKRWGAQLHFDLAFREYRESGGPRYPIYIGSAAGSYLFNKVNRLVFGVETEYASGVFHLRNHESILPDESQSRKEATRYMLFVADELLFGDLGVLFLFGIYTKKKPEVHEIVYNKLSLRYYLPAIGKPKTRFYAAIYLKAHLSVAEYIAFGMGAAL